MQSQENFHLCHRHDWSVKSGKFGNANVAYRLPQFTHLSKGSGRSGSRLITQLSMFYVRNEGLDGNKEGGKGRQVSLNLENHLIRDHTVIGSSALRVWAWRYRVLRLKIPLSKDQRTKMIGDEKPNLFATPALECISLGLLLACT